VAAPEAIEWVRKVMSGDHPFQRVEQALGRCATREVMRVFQPTNRAERDAPTIRIQWPLVISAQFQILVIHQSIPLR
jgi:hypothetical protein